MGGHIAERCNGTSEATNRLKAVSIVRPFCSTALAHEEDLLAPKGERHTRVCREIPHLEIGQAGIRRPKDEYDRVCSLIQCILD